MPGAISPAAAQGADAAPAPLDVVLRVNGTEHRLTLDPRTTLLDALREHLHLTGSKKGCGLGQCGACTVLMDGKRVKSCLSLAALVEGREITTIEGLAQGERAPPAAGRLHRARRLPVRLLHARADHGRRRLHRRGPRRLGAGDPRLDERQPVPLRRLRPHRRGHPGRGGAPPVPCGEVEPCTPSPSNARATWPPPSPSRAQAGRNDAPAEYIAGGTDMVQLLQEYVRRPERLVSLAGLLDNRIEVGPQGLRLGAAATMAEVAAHPAVVEQFPVIAEALLNSASPQVRNQATMGGNLLQRTRCPYFRDVGYAACNKRAPGSGCAAIGGENRWHAVLGTSENCIAANPSDLAVALVALDAAVEVRGAGGQRTVPLVDFHRLPGDTPHIETVLEPGEVIAAITVPANPAARRSHYLKVRDRASFEFAVVSAAVALEMDGARIRQARVALGGVGTKPWRVPRVEAALAGASLDPAALRPAAALAAEGAQGRGHNDFKIELMQRAIVRAVETAGARA